jgi:hypothetical protein
VTSSATKSPPKFASAPATDCKPSPSRRRQARPASMDSSVSASSQARPSSVWAYREPIRLSASSYARDPPHHLGELADDFQDRAGRVARPDRLIPGRTRDIPEGQPCSGFDWARWRPTGEGRGVSRDPR